MKHRNNVLLLSSNVSEKSLISQELTQTGADVIPVASVKEALLALREKPVSLFLFELKSIFRDRNELIRSLKSHKTLREVPVLGIVSPMDSSEWKQWENDGVDDFVIQPVNGATLRKKISRLLPGSQPNSVATPPPASQPAASNVLDELKRKIFLGQIDLPSQPRLLHQLIEMMQNDNANLNSIGALLEKEPSVSARVLRAANSVHFASASKVRTVGEALGRIGLDRALNYVMVLSNDQMFSIEKPPLKEIREKLWRHTLTVAVASKLLGTELSFSRPDALFAFGLLHDLGKLVLLRILQSMPAKVREDTSVQGIEAALNRLHCELGGNVFEQWNFPEEFVYISRYHHQPPVPSKHGKYLIIIGFCNLLAHEMEFGLNEKLIKGLLRTPHASILKLRYQQILDLEKKTREESAMLDSLM